MMEGDINKDDWAFFLRGGVVLDRTDQPPKPQASWISDAAWDNITNLYSKQRFFNFKNHRHLGFQMLLGTT